MSRLARLRVVPWLLLFEVGRGVRSHVLDSLSPAERRRVAEILRNSRGRPANVSARERDELRRLAGKLDFKRLAQDIAPRIVASQGKRRR